MKIKDLKNDSKNIKIEDTKEYRDAVEKSNKLLHDYEFEKELMYKKAENFIAI